MRLPYHTHQVSQINLDKKQHLKPWPGLAASSLADNILCHFTAQHYSCPDRHIDFVFFLRSQGSSLGTSFLMAPAISCLF